MGKSPLRTAVTFICPAFKTVDFEDKPRFRGAFGDDVALWLMMEMQSDGMFVVPGLHQSNTGWFYAFRVNSRRYIASISMHDGARSMWLVSVERDVRGLAAAFGGRRRGVQPSAVQSIHNILARSERVTAIWWYLERDLRTRNDGKGASSPTGTANATVDPASELSST